VVRADRVGREGATIRVFVEGEGGGPRLKAMLFRAREGALIVIDRRITGRDRSAYFEQKLNEALHESDVRVSLVTDRNGGPIGFIMARVDFGEFGRIAPTAVVDTIGIDPDYWGQGIGRALLSQLLVNLQTLRVEYIRTEVDWRDRELLAFLDHCDFRSSQQLCFEHDLKT
jgi:GNAT superfamily N-acetyltransferase